MPTAPTDRFVPAADAPPLAGKDQLNDLLWEVSTYVELMGEAELADTPLTLPSSGMLASVLAEPGITIAEISRRLPKSQQAVSQVVARLEKLGYLERQVGSGRGVGLYVTETGRAAAEQGIACEHALQDRLRELLGDTRYAELSTLLLDARQILREAR